MFLHAVEIHTARLFQFQLIYRQMANILLCTPLLLYYLVLVLLPSAVLAKFVIGVVALLAVPGYLLNLTLNSWNQRESRPGFSILSGVLLQAVNIFSLFIADAFIRFNRLNFPLTILLMTSLETLSMMILSRQKIRSISIKERLFSPLKLSGIVTLGFFLLSLSGNLFFQTLSTTAMLPDGALYLDIARYIINNGGFSSFVINDGGRYPFQYQAGLSLHVGTALLYSFFFSIGNVSYQVAKWATALIGALLVFPVYEMGELSFGKRAGVVACAMTAILPLFKFYAAILYGPEIISALWAVLSLLSLERAISNRSLSYSILSGVTLFFTSLVWLGDIVPLVGAFALTLALKADKKDRTLSKFLIQSLSPMPLFGILLVALLFASNIQVWLIMLAVICGLLASYRSLNIDNLKHMAAVSSIFLVLTQLYLVRFYFFPNAVFYPGAVINQAGQPLTTSDIYVYITRFTDYLWPSVYAILTPIVLITAVLSIVWVPSRAPSPVAFVLAWLFARLALVPGQAHLFVIADERFYLSITAILILFSAGFFSHVASVTSKSMRIFASKRLARLYRISVGSNLRTAILTALVLALIFLSSTPAYSNYLKTFYADSVQANGWIPVINWIQNSTNPHDVLITTGSPRLWAWFTDREVVGTFVVANNAILPEDQIGPPEFSHLISQFSPTYVIFDSSFQAALMFLPKLSYLYGNFQPGTILSLNSTSGSVILEVIISSVSAVNNGTVTLYRIMK